MKRGGISFRITFFSLVIALAAMTGFAFISIKLAQDEMLVSHRKTGMDMALLISRMSRNALMLNDYQFLSEIPDIIQRTQEKGAFRVRECGIVSTQGKYIVNSFPSKDGAAVGDPVILDMIARFDDHDENPVYVQRNSPDRRGAELVIVTDISAGSQNWGYVVLTTSLAAVHRMVGVMALKSAAAIAILSALVMFLVSFASRRSLLPLNRLNKKIRRLVEEKKLEKLHYDSNDEVGELIRSVNSMMDTWRDMYENSVARQEEADSQRRLSDAVVENIANGILVLDRQGQITRANRSIEVHIGLNASALPGKLFWEVFPGWENENSRDTFHKVIKTGDIYSNERVYYRAEALDREIIFNVSICPLKDNNRDILGAVVLFEFTTDKVLLEEHLFKANEDLKRASELKSEFLSMVSHELRTPLTLIKMYSSMLEERKLGPLSDRQAKAVEVMSRRCRNLHELIDDLLDLSKIESGRMELQIQEISLEELAKEAAGTFSSRAEAGGLEFSCSVAEKLPPVIADREKIARVLNNLMENALKFTENGGITVIVTRDPDNVRQALVRVSDTGCGIPEEHFNRIFDKFYQVDGSDTRKHGGSGLGLSIASEIVSLHQGKMKLDSSTVGKGSSFTFTIPFTHPEIAAAIKKNPLYTGEAGVVKEKEKPAAIPTSGKHVLLVDDDRDFLDMMADVLEEDGFIVHSATDGLKGIELLFADEPVNVILLDVTMPLISGYELCRMIKSLKSKNSIPVLMLTAAGQSEQIRKGFEAGAAGYLVKPFTLEVFRETLFKIMREE